MSAVTQVITQQLTRERPSRPGGTASGLSRAMFLCRGALSADDRNVTKVLDFFGIPWTAVSAAEIMGNVTLPAMIDRSNFCIFSSASCLAEVMQDGTKLQGALPSWIRDARSVYVYGFQDTDQCRNLLRFLTNDARGSIRVLDTPQVLMSVTNDFPEMCGPLSGMHVRVPVRADDRGFEVNGGFQGILRANDCEAFCAVTCGGVRFFLNACCRTVDLNALSTKYFDVKEFFCSAVPLTMFLRWAFSDICWMGAETSGCLIIDDPPLRSRYGFLHFRETLELMDRHNFTTTIAFIPWNWKRTTRSTVDIFRTRPDRFSLAIHGCDHTASEFASHSTAFLDNRLKVAGQRMEGLLQRTSVQHDRVMVFPQGEFSPETGRALKSNNFVAAVNTEVAPSNGVGNETTIGDLWQIANTTYCSFPLFTMRYLTHGVENFAFDALLGKPCLIVAHHDVFKGQGRDLVEFIGKLNSLKWNLRWRPLGDVIRGSFRVRVHADGTNIIQMYANELVIENASAEPLETLLLKRESDLDCVKAVMVNQTAIHHEYGEGCLQFRMTVSPKSVARIRVLYFDQPGVNPGVDGIGYRMKTSARRYLSEFRDNYVSQSAFLSKAAMQMKRLLK